MVGHDKIYFKSHMLFLYPLSKWQESRPILQDVTNCLSESSEETTLRITPGPLPTGKYSSIPIHCI